MHSFSGPSTPAKEINRRIGELQGAMAEQGLEAALIVHRPDLFYFSGSGQDAHLFVPMEGTPTLLVRKSYERAAAESPLESVRQVNGWSDFKRAVVSVHSGPIRGLGMELDVLPVNNFRHYESLFPGVTILDLSSLVREVRMVKSPYEVELIENAGAMGDALFSFVGEAIEEGMAEMELAGILEGFLRKRGHQGYCRIRSFNQEVFYGHIMSGANLAIPGCSPGPTCGPGLNASMPQSAGDKLIRRNEPVQVDYLSNVGGYMVDQARTFFLGGVPEKFLRVHAVALSIQRAITTNGVPGARAEDLYNMALAIAEEAGCAKGFMGYPQPVPFVGHGIGLEVDELPVIGKKSPNVLREGMVVALEPKFIIPDEGLAGIENTFVVSKRGLRQLTRFDDEIQELPR